MCVCVYVCMKGCEEDQVLITGFNILLGTLKSSKLCVESEMCGFTRSQLQCKMMLFVPSFLFVLPDWMNVLVSLDRLMAVCRHTAQFYRVHCTRKAAWKQISCLLVLLGVCLYACVCQCIVCECVFKCGCDVRACRCV